MGKLLVKGGIAIQKAINSCMASRDNAEAFQAWPASGWNHISYRGSGVEPAELDCWRKMTTGKKYRAAAPLATSIRECVAQHFLTKVPYGLKKVLFIFAWESGDTPCMHARFIEALTSCPGEDEMFLVAYSALEFASMEEADGTTTKINVKVCRDNKLEPEYLPIAIWH